MQTLATSGGPTASHNLPRSVPGLGSNVSSLPCCSVPFSKVCSCALLMCASRESPDPSSFSSPRQQLLTAPSAQTSSLATNYLVSEPPSRQSGPLGYWGLSQACSRHLTSVFWGSPELDLELQRWSEMCQEQARMPSPCLSGCASASTAQLAGTWPPLLQGSSQVLTPHPGPEPFQHICLPNPGCPLAGASPAPWHAVALPLASL